MLPQANAAGSGISLEGYFARGEGARPYLYCLRQRNIAAFSGTNHSCSYALRALLISLSLAAHFRAGPFLDGADDLRDVG